MNERFDFEQILVPYNATFGAEKGLKAAVDFAKKVDGKITLITCVENQSILSFFKKGKNEKFIEQKKIIDNELRKIESKIKEIRPIKHVILKSSFAPETIVEYAQKNKMDIVIVGQTQLSKSDIKYHESMANYLTKGLKCPLLIIK
ncbi:universal stress protein [Nitrosopumilus sp. K4]|uniref:universal stress protein n=1 Tax=Nitrosopumilus sp. K4 TaxID=2795383 RepID=UPI001BA9C23C|nr:universal stress protein [Nitrosopumilus sp. K4]QUC64131.1 universal stress protein [Nitrosopumilus sp. K4]